MQTKKITVPAKAEAKNVNQLLVSSLLNYMSDTAQGLARKAAFEDPDRAITFLSHLKDIKQGERDAHAQALRASEMAKRQP